MGYITGFAKTREEAEKKKKHFEYCGFRNVRIKTLWKDDQESGYEVTSDDYNEGLDQRKIDSIENQERGYER